MALLLLVQDVLVQKQLSRCTAGGRVREWQELERLGGQEISWSSALSRGFCLYCEGNKKAVHWPGMQLSWPLVPN